jgi:2,3-bisphosphoglycerate-dependent phosphoglycerate mutase
LSYFLGRSRLQTSFLGQSGDVTLLEPVAQRGQRRLWLVRHGESTWNVLGLAQGHMALPVLTRRGGQQARQCARLLAGKPVGAIVSSDLRRAAQTALPIGRALHLPVSHDHRLRERSLGTAEGRPHAVLGSDQLGIAGGRVVDTDAAPPGGETVRQFYERLAACVSELLSDHRDGDLVLVCHGGVVRVVSAWLDGIGPEEMAWPEVTNGIVVDRAAPSPALVTSSLHHLPLGGKQ